ncbi:MAG: type II secretion system F family protein [Prosthecobacter sp.]|jgi:type IV pilus assembly protein PilC|uniref:type II secretion system F family protein n=1 Tax=Prosthecobacter sp. TaxID=1965333 RepID=UPI001A080A66|nr:type II secretion system F family protein [Prosthecobacter sp.]MBE2282352.1 type II secretion system F family protein [Prosthecobacter sp.]
MPKFHYIALDQNGQETAGDLDAASEADAINQLRQSGLYPTSVAAEGQGQAAAIKKRAKSSTKGKAKVVKVGANAKVKSKSLMIFTRQLATLIDSGLPLLRGLTVLGRQEPNLVMKATINTLADNVQTGSTFSESLQQYPRIFNKLYINMVKAGELGGVLELVLNRLAEYQEKAQKLKNKIVAAMVYPIIVMCIAAAIMVFLMMVIVPRFETIFEDMLGSKDKLPELTKWVIGFSRNMFEYKWYLLGGLISVITGWRAIAATKGGRRWIDRTKLKLPLFGDVQRKTAISRFTRTLGTLVTSGVPILQALNITRDTAGNTIVSDAITKVHDAVKEGESMVAPLESSGVFPPMVISMVDVGEETGQLPEMLLKIADVYEDEVDNSVSALTSMLEPLMIVVLALVVGVIVMALFLPLIDVIKNLSGGAGG